MARVLVLLLCLVAVREVLGQGLLPSQSPTVGASSTLSQLQQLYSSSKSWRQSYKQQPKSACSRMNSASLCASANTFKVDAYAQLMLATSPYVYSSLSDSAVRVVGPAQDQGWCQTCAAFAVAAAAETAMASALHADVEQCSISVHAMYFCPLGRPGRSCTAGWNLAGALEQLHQQGQKLPTAACMPYQPDYRLELTTAQLCSGKCNNPSHNAGLGQFSSTQITSMWEAQLHIRRYGAIVSRFDVYTDFRSFFADKHNTQKIYRPGASARFEFAHAITLIGYNNQQQYWLAKNSWGSGWGDNGFFKVIDNADDFVSMVSLLSEDVGDDGQLVDCDEVFECPYPKEPRWLLMGFPLLVNAFEERPRINIPQAEQTLIDAENASRVVLSVHAQVAYGVCSVLTPEAGEAYGVVWALGHTPYSLQLPVKSAEQGCYWYEARHGDYLSKVAWMAGILLETFMLDNIDNIKDLDVSVQGHRLLLCNPKQGTFYEASTDLQLEALMRVKAAIDTNNVLYWWSRDAGINAGYCMWRGVGCKNNTSTVFEINIWSGLYIEGLKGTLPQADTFAGLLGLTDIGISRQPGIRGTLPSDWSALTQLQDIRLQGNSLVGSIPPAWGNLTQLKALMLHSNQLTGRIPPSFESLTLLAELSLQNNTLSGTIPDLSRASSKLNTLALYNNKLSGGIPAYLGAMKSLRRLALYGNELTGTIPNMTTSVILRELYLNHNNLTGSIPVFIKRLVSLEGLDLAANKLTGTIPDLSSLVRLTLLSLYENRLQGTIPTSIRSLKLLETLNLSDNMLTGTIPDMGRLSKLEVLHLHHNQLNGVMPDSFNQLTALQWLSLASNRLTGTVPNLDKLTMLTFFGLSNNKLHGRFPDSVKAMVLLTDLGLSSNSFTGTLPAWLGSLINLVELVLYQNNFTGTIPASIGNMTRLKRLELAANQLTGTLPDAMRTLTSLELLQLRENTLLGSVPASWSAMKRLSYVGLSSNPQLRGCLPASWKPMLSGLDLWSSIYRGTKIRGFC